MAGLVLCVVAGLVGYQALSRPERATLPGASPSGTPTAGREDAAAEVLRSLTRALGGGEAADLTGLAAPGAPAAERELAEMRANVRRLGITDLSMRYIDEDAVEQPEVPARLAARAWVAQVRLRWRIAGFERAANEMDVDMTFARTTDGAAFVSARDAHGDAAPLWLLDDLSVARADEALVMSTGDAGLRTYSRLAARAVRDVRKVFPRWDGKLVVEVPGSQRELGRVLGVDGDTYRTIAAVTTPADGSADGGSPVHIFVNPPVFDPLGPRGAQIVMSHEAAHVATGAATASIPTWLLEGFADYVALAYVDLPVQVTASQIIAQVRKDGVPRRLPGKEDFEPDDPELGASYEAAWLACRLLAETYGRQRLIAFYERVDRDGDTRQAFTDVLGTTEREFTADWRRYLREVSR